MIGDHGDRGGLLDLLLRRVSMIGDHGDRGGLLDLL